MKIWTAYWTHLYAHYLLCIWHPCISVCEAYILSLLCWSHSCKYACDQVTCYVVLYCIQYMLCASSLLYTSQSVNSCAVFCLIVTVSSPCCVNSYVTSYTGHMMLPVQRSCSALQSCSVMRVVMCEWHVLCSHRGRMQVSHYDSKGISTHTTNSVTGCKCATPWPVHRTWNGHDTCTLYDLRTGDARVHKSTHRTWVHRELKKKHKNPPVHKRTNTAHGCISNKITDLYMRI